MHVVILGAGLAGLSAAHALCVAGHRVTLLEKQADVGGMASSWQVGPFWLDHGPHRFHSRDEAMVAHLYEILDNEVVTRERRSRIYLKEKFFDYPLRASNVLSNLPVGVLTRAILDYLWIRVRQWFRPIPDSHFENWVVKRFGRTLFDLFFGTYTSKAWGMPTTEISADWAQQRISQANLWDTIVKTLRPPKNGEVRSLVTQFWYPKHGGIGQLSRKYAEKIRRMGGEIWLSTPVERIDVERGRAVRVVYIREGVRVELACDQVISTIPLPRLLETLNPAIDNATRAAISRLKYIGIVFVYLEVTRPSVMPDHWVYLPQKDLTVHRITEFKNFSDTSAPGDRTVVCCEITCRPGDERWKLSLAEAARIAEADMIRIGLIAAGEARAIDIARLPYAYPVYDLQYKENLEVLRKATAGIANLGTTGRQGLYRYNNMDHSIAMGQRFARQVASGIDVGAESVALEREYFG